MSIDHLMKNRPIDPKYVASYEFGFEFLIRANIPVIGWNKRSLNDEGGTTHYKAIVFNVDFGSPSYLASGGDIYEGDKDDNTITICVYDPWHKECEDTHPTIESWRDEHRKGNLFVKLKYERYVGKFIEYYDGPAPKDLPEMLHLVANKIKGTHYLKGYACSFLKSCDEVKNYSGNDFFKRPRFSSRISQSISRDEKYDEEFRKSFNLNWSCFDFRLIESDRIFAVAANLGEINALLNEYNRLLSIDNLNQSIRSKESQVNSLREELSSYKNEEGS